MRFIRKQLRDWINMVDERHERNYDRLNERYWALKHDFDLLVGHLGLHFDRVKAHTKIEKKEME